MAAIAIPIAASSPAWVPWAMTAVGLGGTYLTNKDKIDSSLSNIANFGGLFNRGADDIQWKDGTITTTDGTVVSQPSASVIPIDQTLSTGPLPPSNNKDPNKNISGQARWTAVGELLNKAFPEKKEAQVDVASTEAALEPYGFNENFKLDTENLNKDGSIPIVRSEAGKKADAFLAEKEAWLARTANSPAAQAGLNFKIVFGIDTEQDLVMNKDGIFTSNIQTGKKRKGLEHLMNLLRSIQIPILLKKEL